MKPKQVNKLSHLYKNDTAYFLWWVMSCIEFLFPVISHACDQKIVSLQY